jgi:acyl CoA:acetate/3-ketoacid CoA transferase beta subunit
MFEVSNFFLLLLILSFVGIGCSRKQNTQDKWHLFLLSYAAEQFGQEKADKNTRTMTKTNLKDVVITDTVETDVRKEQHVREKDWKEAGRQQIKDNTNFDMARALF